MKMNTTEKLSLLMCIATGILVCITGFYTFYTYRMVSIMKETFLLERRPYITLENIKVVQGKIEDSSDTGIQIELIFKNVGKVITNYTVKSILVIIDDKTVTNPNFKNLGGSIFPGISTVFRYPPIKIDIPKIPLKGVIDYTIEYSSVPKDTCYTSHKKIEILVDNVQTKLTFLEENET